MIIYKGTNLVNGMMYIGQTRRDFDVRMIQHKSNAFNKNGSYEHYIYRALRKYGWENFYWEVIDEADTLEELNEKEKYWIKYYDTFGYKSNGYNMTAGGEGTTGYAHDDEMRLRIAVAHGAKPFLLFDMNGCLYKRYVSKKECQREEGIFNAVILDALRNKITHAGGYIVVLEEDYTSFGDELVKEKIKNAKMSNRGSNRHNSIINEEIVREIKTLLVESNHTHDELAKKFGVTRGVIGSISRGRDWCHVEVDGFVPRKTRPSKLKEEDIIEIKKMLIEGVHHKVIAEYFDVGQPNISSIARGNTWSHIKVEGFIPMVRVGGENSPTSKLTEADVIKIKQMLKDGMISPVIAEIFNVKKSTIYDIKQGRTWKSVAV